MDAAGRHRRRRVRPLRRLRVGGAASVTALIVAIALYLSQPIVFAVYPLYRRRPSDVALAAIAFALMARGARSPRPVAT